MKNEELIKKRRTLKNDIRELIKDVERYTLLKKKYSGEARDSQMNDNIKKLSSANKDLTSKKAELQKIEAELKKLGLLGKSSEFKSSSSGDDDF